MDKKSNRKECERDSIKDYIITFRNIMMLLLSSIGAVFAFIFLNRETLDDTTFYGAIFGIIVLTIALAYVISHYIELHTRLENLYDE